MLTIPGPVTGQEHSDWLQAGSAEPFQGISILSTNRRAAALPRARAEVAKTITYKRRKGTLKIRSGAAHLRARRR